MSRHTLAEIKEKAQEIRDEMRKIEVGTRKNCSAEDASKYIKTIGERFDDLLAFILGDENS
ncbi:hypothetical protein M0R19_04905 [Candidatus Pacearchaeota archaeon]|jgi:hypothetical protein|nr:hypothetical protein [Candidatus Pacearchaeota archaeon]